jgi:hypothetical protein
MQGGYRAGPHLRAGVGVAVDNGEASLGQHVEADVPAHLGPSSCCSASTDPTPAPQIASASVLISASANIFTPPRSKSEVAGSSCSCSQPNRSTLGPAAIACLLDLNSLVGYMEDHAVAVSAQDATLIDDDIGHHGSGRNCALPQGLEEGEGG